MALESCIDHLKMSGNVQLALASALEEVRGKLVNQDRAIDRLSERLTLKDQQIDLLTRKLEQHDTLLAHLHNTTPAFKENVPVDERLSIDNDLKHATQGDGDNVTGGDGEQDDDILQDEDIPPPRHQQGGRRRGAVSSEAVTEEDIANYKKKSIPKSHQEMLALHEALNKNVLFKYLDDKTISDIFDAVEPKEYNTGENIIVQGEEGDYFYIIHKGEVDIYVNDAKVGQIGEGGSFGELALIYGLPRQATITVKDTCNVTTFRLDRESYRMLLMGNTLKRRKMYEEFLKKVAILEGLENWETLNLADSLESINYSDGQIVVKQGDPGDNFFIIVQGEAKVLQKKDGDSEEVEVGTLKTSDYFGEIALILNRPRAATVIAQGKLECVKVDRQRFERILGPCQDILKRNMDQYKSIIQLYP